MQAINANISQAIRDEHAADETRLREFAGSFSECMAENILDEAHVQLQRAAHEGARGTLNECRGTQSQFDGTRTTCLGEKNTTCNHATTVCNDVNSENIACAAPALGEDVTAYIVRLKEEISTAKGRVQERIVVCENATTDCQNYTCPGDQNSPNQMPTCAVALASLHGSACA